MLTGIFMMANLPETTAIYILDWAAEPGALWFCSAAIYQSVCPGAGRKPKPWIIICQVVAITLP